MQQHRQFEFFASEYLKQNGFQTEVTPAVADWGVDVFATKDGKSYVVQAKMYGDSKTQVNRQMMMELFGVMHYFDCQGAIMIYNGSITEDAKDVAEKLGIQLIYLELPKPVLVTCNGFSYNETDVFATIWDDIRQLKGKVINKTPDAHYTIEDVTDGDISYRNKNNTRHRESSDLFRRIVSYIVKHGMIRQSQFRGEFNTYSSAFITAILAQTSQLQVTKTPFIIRFRPTDNANPSDS